MQQIVNVREEFPQLGQRQNGRLPRETPAVSVLLTAASRQVPLPRAVYERVDACLLEAARRIEGPLRQGKERQQLPQAGDLRLQAIHLRNYEQRETKRLQDRHTICQRSAQIPVWQRPARQTSALGSAYAVVAGPLPDHRTADLGQSQQYIPPIPGRLHSLPLIHSTISNIRNTQS